MPFVTFMVAFAVMCSGLASAATLSRAFGGDYLSAFVSWDAIIVGLGFLVVIGLINMIMASRLLYGMAREGILPAFFAKVLPHRQTPWTAILFTSLLAAGLLVTGELGSLADTTVLLLLVFAVVNVCVLILRKDRVKGEYFKAPTIMPVIGFIVSLALLTTKEPESLARAGLLLIIGAILYLINWFGHGRHQPDLNTREMKRINVTR